MRTIRNVLLVVLLLACLVAAPASADGVDVVPGAALKGADGSVTFTGGGFAPRTPVQLSINGLPHSNTRSTGIGAFVVQLHLQGAGNQALAATGTRLDGGTHVVTATIHIGPVVPLLPREAKLASQGPGRVYRALGAGLGTVVVAVGVSLGIRLAARRRRATP